MGSVQTPAQLEPAAVAQFVMDVQLLRRYDASPETRCNWSIDLKTKVVHAESRLRASSGLDLAKALIEYGRITGQRVKV